MLVKSYMKQKFSKEDLDTDSKYTIFIYIMPDNENKDIHELSGIIPRINYKRLHKFSKFGGVHSYLLKILKNLSILKVEDEVEAYFWHQRTVKIFVKMPDNKKRTKFIEHIVECLKLCKSMEDYCSIQSLPLNEIEHIYKKETR